MEFLNHPAFWKLAASVVALVSGAIYGRNKMKESDDERFEDALSLARTCYLMVEKLAARGKLKAIPALGSSINEVKQSRGISEFIEGWKRMGYGEAREGDLDIARLVFKQWSALDFDGDGELRDSSAGARVP